MENADKELATPAANQVPQGYPDGGESAPTEDLSAVVDSTCGADMTQSEQQRREVEQSLREHAEALHKANTALKEMCERAEAATKAKSQFLADMGHEIRTPMTAILGYANVLLDYAHEDATIEAAQIIKRNGEHLLSLINDVLDLARIEAGKEKIEVVACSPRQVAAEVVALMKARADAKGLDLSLETRDSIPAEIQSDPGGCDKSSSTSLATPSSSPTAAEFA